MICIFSFPRSGSTWFLDCLNTVDGIKLCNEPVYGLRGHRVTRWLEARHSEVFTGNGSYRGDYMQPTPSATMREHLPPLFEDLARHGCCGYTGWKEVYLCHKIPLVLQGIRAGGITPRVVHLWRSFDGVAASFEKRGFYGWVVQTFDSQREGSKGTEVEPIYYMIEPKDDLEKLFVIWLAATYRDQQDALAAGGVSVCYEDLSDGYGWRKLWSPKPTSIDAAIFSDIRDATWAVSNHKLFDTPERARIRADVRNFKTEHKGKLLWLRLTTCRLVEGTEWSNDLYPIIRKGGRA